MIKKNYNLLPANQITENDDILILPQEYFYPIPIGLQIDESEKNKFVTQNTYTIHWNSGNWESSDLSNGRDYFLKNKHRIPLEKLLKYCFEKRVIFDNLFLQIEKYCQLYKIKVNFYWFFRFKYKSDYKNNRWLVLFIFGVPFKIWKMYKGN